MTRRFLSNRRTFLGAAGAAAVFSAAKSASATLTSVRRRPNIVLITADDLGYGDLSGYGRADFQTPVLDRLAAQGTRFTHAYAIAPICTPTRVGLMTGQYPARHPIGLHEPLVSDFGLDPSSSILASLLKESGYTNALFGKWHLGARPQFHPNRHGFDVFFGPLSGAIDYVAHTDTAGRHDLYRNDEPVHLTGYATDLIADEAVRFIRERREPFFLSHQGTAPHWPWQKRGDPPTPPPWGQGRRSVGAGPPGRFPDMMRALDEAVGRILAALEETGVAERTLVIFTSDNGGDQYSNMGGLAKSKGHVWEGGIRVPTFARWPGIIPAGTTTPQVATTLDWTGTILAAAGASPKRSHPLDGVDLLPILTNGKPVERTIFWRVSQRLQQAAVRHAGWKYLRDKEGEYLFDLILDAGERRDVKEQNMEVFQALKAAYDDWERKMLPPLPPPVEPRRSAL